jgi:hypothetical protein
MIWKDQRKYPICYSYDSMNRGDAVRIKFAADRNGSTTLPLAVIGENGADSVIWLDRLKAKWAEYWDDRIKT